MIEQMIVGQVFGDTVELASLMESSGSAMKIQITSATKVEYYSLCLSITLHSVLVNEWRIAFKYSAKKQILKNKVGIYYRP